MWWSEEITLVGVRFLFSYKHNFMCCLNTYYYKECRKRDVNAHARRNLYYTTRIHRFQKCYRCVRPLSHLVRSDVSYVPLQNFPIVVLSLHKHLECTFVTGLKK